MWDSFHGASLEAISIGGEAHFRRDIGPLLPGAEHVPPSDEYHCLWDCQTRGGCDLKCAEYIEYVLEKEGDIAAVIAEPVRSTPYIPRPEYWQRIREACNRQGALLIFDEIPNALGRTGKMFTCEHYDVVPDILVIGKGLGGGILPLAGVIVRQELDLAADRSLGHYTHEKNPVSCAAALATIDYIEENDLLANADQVGRYAMERMETMMADFSLIGDVRGLGLLLGMELVQDRDSRARATDEAEAVMYNALSRGLSFKITMGNILTLTPPLIISQDEMEQAMDILEQSIKDVQQE
jgi:4-aminobutyrate aminotransferase